MRFARAVSTTNQTANTASIQGSIRGRRATMAIAAATTRARGQEIRSMRPAMIGDLDARRERRDIAPMALPWWLPFGAVPEVPARKLAAVLAEARAPQVVDVRTGAEFRRGHLRGAIWVPVNELRHRLPSLGLDRRRPVVAICLTAHRSIPAVRLLRRAGFEASHLAGGMLAWRAAGFPEELGGG